MLYNRGWASSREDVRRIAGIIAQMNGFLFRVGILRKAWISALRSCHPQPSYRATRPKKIAKDDAKYPEHGRTLIEALKTVEEARSGISAMHCTTSKWNK